jgi:dTDP-4-dehydrorhamnose 3,5-epimerase
MNVVKTALADVLILEPKVFGDERGFFFESFNRRTFASATGIDIEFVQDNHSRSALNVLRGLHYQIERPQGKLLRVIAGEVFDVAVDVRKNSPTFGKHAGFRLSSDNKRMAWIPAGFAHGFLVLSEHAEVLYKTTEYWYPNLERTLSWNDPEISIAWPLSVPPLLSAKDRVGLSLTALELSD